MHTKFVISEQEPTLVSRLGSGFQTSGYDNGKVHVDVRMHDYTWILCLLQIHCCGHRPAVLTSCDILTCSSQRPLVQPATARDRVFV
jgi:hypothetical protein